MKVFLKIKLKAFSNEVRLTRREELKFPKGRRNHPTCVGLRNHRMGFRNVLREGYLAYGFLRGRDYIAIENSPKTTPNWAEVLLIAQDYGSVYFKKGNTTLFEEFWQWVQKGQADLRTPKKGVPPVVNKNVALTEVPVNIKVA